MAVDYLKKKNTISCSFISAIYSLKRILQHFSMATYQTDDAMTTLLTLLISHRPIPDYDSLPRTGAGLLPIFDCYSDSFSPLSIANEEVAGQPIDNQMVAVQYKTLRLTSF